MYIDFSHPPPDKILTKMKDIESNTYISLFIDVSCERLPGYCTNYEAFIHGIMECKKTRGVVFQKELTKESKHVGKNENKSSRA